MEVRDPQQEQEEIPVNRDHVILRIMGCFFCVFALLVAIGLFWPQSSEARLVSGSAAFVLFACGCLAFWFRRSR